MRALGLILVATLGSGCIIEPPDLIRLDGGDEWPDGGKRPTSDGGFDIEWDGGLGGGGGGWDGGAWDAGSGPRGNFPGGGANGDRGTGVLWLVRIDRSTANLAASYGSLIETMTQQLIAQGFDIRRTAVGSLYEPRLLSGNESATPSAASVQSLLESAATYSGTTPTGCSSQHLLSLTVRLSEATVASSGSRPFADPLGALLVVMIDHGSHPQDYGPGCDPAEKTPAERFGVEHMPWLNIGSPPTSAWRIPRSQTRFLFVSTSENESYAQLRERCARMSTFPRTALDAISPSEHPFYEPFSVGLNGFQPGLGTRIDLCQAVAQDWAGFSRGFARNWAQLLSLPADQR
ncbi:hypothetical protein CYFUS_009069 [Cystobacter fuscus]|uniref:Lipoprotein n=1 Tax=Cystobacter fuscus TaxID=43 RepID=A0A250JI64_9BACT|nr:hypothetical protein [Cystobacter fuscus]ATB43589.1 hypothetical protein CYFUS_009069 [Cystobacter fuscus]